MAAEEDRLSLGLEAQDQVPDLFAAHRVEPRHGLVQKDRLGIVDQGLGKPDPLEHPLGVLAEL